MDRSMFARVRSELDRERMQLQNEEKKIVVEIKKMAKEGQMVRAYKHARRRISSLSYQCFGLGSHLTSVSCTCIRAARRFCVAVCCVVPTMPLTVTCTTFALCCLEWLEPVQDAVKVMAKSLVRNRNAVTKMYGLKSQLQAVSLRLATLKSTQAMAEAMGGATKAMRMMNRQLNMPQLHKIMREFERQNERMEMTSEMMGDAVDDAMGVRLPGHECDCVCGDVLMAGMDRGADGHMCG
eukprot:365632-Chlamydomonas_euryale.AAC.27